jgi:GT2 family glycosyltransferase
MDETIWAIIPTYNRRELLRECIQAVLGQTRPPEVLWVLDNCSTDGTAEMVQRDFPQVRLVRRQQNLGSSGGFAEGITVAYAGGADWIWLVDNDAVPQPDALEQMLVARQRIHATGLEVAALGSVALWTDGKLHPFNRALPNWRFLKYRRRLRRLDCQPVRWSSFVSVLLSRWAVEKYGVPYYDYFTWNDDLEYFGRIGRRELIVFAQKSVVVHKTKTPYTAGKSKGERFFYDVRNRLWVLRGRAFDPLEKLWLIGNFLGHICQYLLGNGKKGVPVVWRGVYAGFTTRPRH